MTSVSPIHRFAGDQYIYILRSIYFHSVRVLFLTRCVVLLRVGALAETGGVRVVTDRPQPVILSRVALCTCSAKGTHPR